MAENRLNRELETREKTTRKKAWNRPEVLPSPNPEPGYAYRWEPVLAKDHPEIFVVGGESERFKDNVVIGGLLLCKAPVELVGERNEFYQEQAEAQINSVDNNFMRENDPRMPLFNERKTKVTFGKGS
jgi:hypothetical protein